jgi:hypothetical protein
MEREINFLSDGELDAVVGGRMNNGQINQLVLKNPQYGIQGSGGKDGVFDQFCEFGLIALGAIVIGGVLGGGSKT